MRYLRMMALWCALLPLITCSATSLFFRHVDVKTGLADNFVRDIVRDSYGYMWVSTINGLSRYDGYHICNYLPLSLGGYDNDIAMVRETADTTLWMVGGGEVFTYVRNTATWQKDGAQRLNTLGISTPVRVFYVDERRNLWVANDQELCYYDYSQHNLSRIPLSGVGRIIHIVSKNGQVVVVTDDNHIYMVNLRGQRLVSVAQAPDTTYSRDTKIYLDSHGNLWFYQSHSLASMQWVLSLKSGQWTQLSEFKRMGDTFINAITEDDNGQLWVGTGNAGIYIFDSHGRVEGMKMTGHVNPFMLTSSHISCFYLDDNNTMWVGSAKLGIAFTDLGSPEFQVVSTEGKEDVTSLVQDSKGNLWIAFDGSGVMMRSTAGATTSYTARQRQLPSDIVTSLVVSADGSIVAGTYGDGLARFDGSHFVPIYSNQPALRYVKALAADTDGNLWVATVDKGVFKVGTDGNVTGYNPDNTPLPSHGTLSVVCDSLRKMVYVGTSTGIGEYDGAQGRFIATELTRQLKGAYVASLAVCRRNLLWIGCRDGLRVYDPRDGKVRLFTTQQGMSHNSVRSIACMDDKVWMATDNGLTCITVQRSGQDSLVFKCHPFHASGGLSDVIFSNDAALATAEGTVLVGCYSGYVSINEGNMSQHYPRLRVEFTESRINGQEDHQFFATHTLKHHQRLTVYVSAMVPALNNQIVYLYRFKGEKEWQRAPDNMLYFASLTPGTHVLQVKAELPGVMESDVAELTIEKLPPLWLSKPALLFYLLLALAALYLLNRALRNKQKRKMAMKQMKLDLEKYEMEEDKIRFFTNISHDLKTPLTLVVAPLEKIREGQLPAPVRAEVDVAWRNARQLYDLILQLLDFRRLDEGKEKLNLRHGDIVAFVRQTVQGFSYLTASKQIRMTLKLPPASIEVNFDENKLRRVITNLLSNAFKYNNDHGTVDVSLAVSEKEANCFVTLRVADTGIGIHDKKHVFDRFVQETHGREQEGSGLGLHIVKRYVDMMGGVVSVSDNQPKGTVFTVMIPVNQKIDLPEQEMPVIESLENEVAVIEEEGPKDRPVLLIVDDNTDARLFLQRSLADEYDVVSASNGKEALQSLEANNHVDLVVSDVMMPEMDGIELFRRLKANINYSHIPVILLTAKSSEESIVAGLQEGVADYITKPFSLAVLKLRMRKVLEWTRDVHQNVANGIEIEPSEITVSSLDEELITNVIHHIEAHIQDVNYSVAQLSSDVGMTRGHLYKKLMAITGKSPIEFIRIIKIKRGKSLLKQGKNNISLVADMVGYSPKQFAHYFKLIYDETPSEYLKKNRQQPQL